MNKEIVEAALQEEAKYVFDKFTAKMALDMGNFIANKAINEDLQLCCEIFVNGRLMFHFLADKCSPDNDSWLMKKRNTVLQFHHSSKFTRGKFDADTIAFTQKYALDPSKYTAYEGGFPITVKGAGVIGAICVSGLTQEQDHQLALDAISLVTGIK